MMNHKMKIKFHKINQIIKINWKNKRRMMIKFKVINQILNHLKKNVNKFKKTVKIN